jgi:single-strand DNA-binding protein
MAFTAEEIDYLDSRAEAEARRNGGPEFVDEMDAHDAAPSAATRPSGSRAASPGQQTRQPAHADA